MVGSITILGVVLSEMEESGRLRPLPPSPQRANLVFVCKQLVIKIPQSVSNP